MKKYFIILLALAILSPTAAAHAFSFIDVINFGERLFYHQVQSAPAEVKSVDIAASAPVSALSVSAKFDNWQKAFATDNISAVIADDRNLYFTDDEINYLINRELASDTDPVARNVAVEFSDKLIKVSGYAMLKSLTGQFYLEAKPTTADNRVSFKVTKARFDNFYFPTFIAQALLAGQLKESMAFLYSDHAYQNLTIAVGSGFIQLDYNN